MTHMTYRPVNKGDEVNVKIESLGSKGDGIAKIEGFVIMIKGANVGEEYKIKIYKVIDKVAFGEIIGKPEPILYDADDDEDFVE